MFEKIKELIAEELGAKKPFILVGGGAVISVGGAMVSEKHCGFVINYDNATATDVINLMKDVQAKVKEKFNVQLEPEVRII